MIQVLTNPDGRRALVIKLPCRRKNNGLLVENLVLSNRTKFALLRAGVVQTAELLTLGKDEISTYRNIGAGAIKEIQAALKTHKLSLPESGTHYRAPWNRHHVDRYAKFLPRMIEDTANLLQ
jgi:DNA-directed RNA polymerase alpha subunit